MINQILAISLGVPAIFLILALTTFALFKNLRPEINAFFSELTRELLGFMKQGIPVPMDYKRIDRPFTGEPVLTQAEAQVENKTRVAG